MTSPAHTPKFIRRLARVMADPAVPALAWCARGDHLVITDRTAFIREALPLLSRTKEYSAFVRQLHFYGFTKERNAYECITAASRLGTSPAAPAQDFNDDPVEAYSNPFFKRDQPDLLPLIQRQPNDRSRRCAALTDTQQLPTLDTSVSQIAEANYRMGAEIERLRERVDQQERLLNGLLDVFSRVFRNGLQSTRASDNPVELTTGGGRVNNQLDGGTRSPVALGGYNVGGGSSDIFSDVNKVLNSDGGYFNRPFVPQQGGAATWPPAQLSIDQRVAPPTNLRRREVSSNSNSPPNVFEEVSDEGGSKSSPKNGVDDMFYY